MFDEAVRDQVRKARGSEGFEQGGKWLHLCIEKSIGKKKKEKSIEKYDHWQQPSILSLYFSFFT